MYLQIAVVFALISRVLDFVAFRWFPAAVIAQVENRYLFTFLSGSVPFLISDILMPVRQALVIQMFDVLDETEKTAKNKVY